MLDAKFGSYFQTQYNGYKALILCLILRIDISNINIIGKKMFQTLTNKNVSSCFSIRIWSKKYLLSLTI